MNVMNVKNVIMTEILESNEIILSPVQLFCNSNNIFDLLIAWEAEKEPDVYVNNYFEEIVPCYSSKTYRSHFRMTRTTMNVLIEELRSVFLQQNVNVDKMIVSLAKKVHITVWLLANYAVTFRECGILFGASTGTVHFIFLQICTAINIMRTKYIKWPNAEACEEIAEATLDRTNFPGVIGAIDGCHIEIKQPCTPNAYDYYNRKQFYSVILQGVCDPSLKFIDIFVGLPGKVHDARVFRLSPLRERINVGLIEENMHLLADSAYGLHQNILTLYRDNGHLTRQQRRYNTKHSAIRSCIERAFGLLKNKFRRLRFLDMNLIEEIPIVITSCCVLHNFVLINEGYEEGEDDLDEVPDYEDQGAFIRGNGVYKRNNIANQL